MKPINQKYNMMTTDNESQEPFRFLSENFVIFENIGDFVRLDERPGWRILLFCTEGRFQIEVNGAPYTIEKNDIAFRTPDKMVKHVMMSPDFRGNICGCSAKFAQCIFPNSADLWNKIFYMNRNFKIHLPTKKPENCRKITASSTENHTNRPYIL